MAVSPVKEEREESGHFLRLEKGGLELGQFILKTRVYLGKEGLDEILTGVSRAFIVTDKFMHEAEWSDT